MNVWTAPPTHSRQGFVERVVVRGIADSEGDVKGNIGKIGACFVIKVNEAFSVRCATGTVETRETMKTWDLIKGKMYMYCT